ncbi:hypothetical protein BV22DRAFT_1190864 [Leucogyrophana mollusca]|uniref:Uncharacterized protein n=1 Tax=Leucogyrophana mollusca TaxID=85980 RepID=A0ACB8C1C5_9AGAM|nr:hypothetical protein BV22DRAFT_1190864 [Leucogyrophana mollusca]
MSSPFAFNYRRRSHSASSPSPSPAPKSTWRPATKRAHSSHRNSPSIPDHTLPHIWDADSWKRGKRPRRDISPSLDYHTGSSSPTSAESRSSGSTSSAPHTPVFAATSAEFLLFPNRSKDCSNAIAHSRMRPHISAAHPDESDDVSEADLARLRSDAFWELRRSVAESGEGLIRRMREYEDSRSKAGIYSRARGIERRRRKRYSPSVPITRAVRKVNSSDSDDDDIQIFSGEPSAGISRQKRASSLGAMDLDSLDDKRTAFRSSDGNDSSPSRDSTYSFAADDSMDNVAVGITPAEPAYSSPSSPAFTFSAYTGASTPAPSCTSLNASAFSLAPLSLSPSHPGLKTTNNLSSAAALQPSSRFHFTSDTPNYTVPISASATRTEKAIAALSLAMANGAGGLSDYEALRAFDHSPTFGDSSQAGELWH